MSDPFETFMLAVHEHGTSGLGYRKALKAYDAAKTARAIEKIEALRPTALMAEWMLDKCIAILKEGE